MYEGFVKKLYMTADMVKCVFCMACRVRSPIIRGTLENSVFVAIKVCPNIHMQPHMLHCITVIPAWSNDLSRLNMILFKQPKTLF